MKIRVGHSGHIRVSAVKSLKGLYLRNSGELGRSLKGLLFMDQVGNIGDSRPFVALKLGMESGNDCERLLMEKKWRPGQVIKRPFLEFDWIYM